MANANHHGASGRPAAAASEPAGNVSAAHLEALGLARDGRPTLAAVLLVGRPSAIARFAPSHEVVFIRYARATRVEARQDLKGPLLGVLDALRRILEAHLRVEAVPWSGFTEKAVPDITWYAAREAVLNGLVHRDYFVSQSVHVSLFGDRLEVASPGGFPDSVTPQNVLRHPPVRRNALLAESLPGDRVRQPRWTGHRHRMRYDDYLAKGYPIASGVIEGACRHLVKDRMERAGMRWTEQGAQAMLDLRSTYVNGQWDEFQTYRIEHETHRLYPHQNALDAVEWARCVAEDRLRPITIPDLGRQCPTRARLGDSVQSRSILAVQESADTGAS